MGKIDSREIGEVDSHGDSASSLLLIKYATESQSICFQPQREEAAQEWKGRNISHIICLSRAFPLGLWRYLRIFILAFIFMGDKGELLRPVKGTILKVWAFLLAH